MVGSLAVTPLRFTGDFLTALAAADDQRGIADILSGELHDRLRLDGVLVHEHLAGRNHTWAQRGVVRPPIAPRIAAVRSGGTQPGSFGYASAGTPRWVIVCARSAAPTDRALVELGQALALEHGEDRVLHLLTLAVARLVEQDGVSAWQATD